MTSMGVPLNDKSNYTALVHASDGDEVNPGERSALGPPVTRVLESSRNEKADVERVCDQLVEQEAFLSTQLADVDRLWGIRRKPLVEQLEKIQSERKMREAEIELLVRQEKKHIEATGLAALSWVDSYWFSALAMLVVILNVGAMVANDYLQGDLKFMGRTVGHRAFFFALDQLFLVYYVFELLVKMAFYQRGLFCGPISSVWWGYLDLTIVMTGILDQWLMPIISADAAAEIDTQWIRVVRLLRLFRVVRVLKILRVFLQSDLSWTENPYFESFIVFVITVNAVVMGLELDVPWSGWTVLDNAMLAIYCFELAVRLKRWRWVFFTDRENWMWNWFDFMIVSGGFVDSWLCPMALFIMTSAGIANSEASDGMNVGPVMTLLRMMRMVRILRLVRLLRQIRPLYRLMLGVLEALQGMQWVMLLTMVLLYTAAIVFTSLVGRGYIYGEEDIPSEAIQNFGTVSSSFFSLFKLMNDDQGVVGPIITTMGGKFLFCVFMVISNWAILAILTSVVSDNMIAASMRTDKEDQKHQELLNQERMKRRLLAIFEEIGKDGDGRVDEDEFMALLENEALYTEFLIATGLTREDDLIDLFNCLASVSEGDTRRSIAYGDLIYALQHENESADKRSIMQLVAHLRWMERRMQGRLDHGLALLGVEPSLMPPREGGIGSDEFRAKAMSKLRRRTLSSIEGPPSSRTL